MNESTLINSLPPEILIRIFHIMLAQPCGLHPYSPYNGLYYRYPDYLAQVCTLWRTIAISSHTLWCHIDLSANQPYSEGLVTRAETHLARAGELPIELHIAVDAIDADTLEYNEVYWLISLISSRVQSLELTMAGTFRDFHRGVFRLLLRQRPNLIKLVLRPQLYHHNSFLVAGPFTTGEEDYAGPLPLDSTEDEIESSFSSLTVLHVRGIFPLWSSKAYHGLVDLRLLSTDTWSHIREAELVTILKSSPGLKILHFELEIHDSTPAVERVTPVTLQDLQVINIIPNSGGVPMLCPGSVLRLLAPGTKPLRLSFEGFYIQDAAMLTELERFFARSRVTRFYTQAVFPPLNLLLRHSTSLEQVVLDCFESSFHSQLPSNPTWFEVDKLASLPRLKSVYVTRSDLFDRELRLLLKCCPDGIVLNSCDFHYRIGIGHPATILDTVEMLAIFPTVRITDHTLYPEEDPTADWDIID